MTFQFLNIIVTTHGKLVKTHPSFWCRLGMWWDTSRQIFILSSHRKSYQKISCAFKTKISLLFIQVVTPISPKSSGLSPRCFIFEFFNLFFSIKAMTPSRCLLRGAVVWVLYYILSCHPPALHSSKCSEISEISDLAHEEHIYIMYYSI